VSASRAGHSAPPRLSDLQRRCAAIPFIDTAGARHGRYLAEEPQDRHPQEGFELAIKLSRMGVKYTQPSDDVRAKLRPEYAEDADSLTMISQVIAINFQTVAAANGYWAGA
jgi:hypothetical protein